MIRDVSDNDKLLLEQIAAGDEVAFSSFFRREYKPVYQAALMVTASDVLAEEVVQDVFLKIWQKRKKLASVSNLRAYLFIIARNQAYRALKKQVRWQAVNANSSPEEQQIHLFDLEEKLQAEALMKLYNDAIGQLPPQQQKVYKLSKQQNMRRQQVAAAMNLQPDTVKKYLASALLNIRAYCLANAPEMLTGILFLLGSPFLKK